MVATNQKIKKEKKRAKRASIDKLTNWYMINLAWGILAIVILRFIESGYSSPETILVMPVLLKSFLLVFALISVALFLCGKLWLSKYKSRLYNYSIFSAVLAIVSAWIAFYPQIRNVLVSLFPGLYSLDSRWWVSWGLIVLLIVYLIVSLIGVSIKAACIERGTYKSK